jgi:putative endonuclease
MEQCFVYVIQSLADGSFYSGMSQNPEQRLNDHNHKKSKYTSSKIPWKLIYIEKCTDSIQARSREKYFKSAAGRRFIKNLIKNQDGAI